VSASPPEWATTLDGDQRAGIQQVVTAAGAVDGVAPLSEHALLHLTARDSRAAQHLLLRAAGGGTAGHELAGYAQLDTTDDLRAHAELVVAPTHRRQGLGSAAIRALRERAPGGRLALWAHGNLPAAAGLAAGAGFRSVRTLWQLILPLTAAGGVGAAIWPAGATVRTFVPGQDDAAWLRCNARSFADHPEQGGWNADDLLLRRAEDWFDPAGFFVVDDPQRPGELAGFHWTKIHPADPPERTSPIGEVYVIGTDPSQQGTGLGKALLVHGLEYLRDRDLDEVMLYVDEDNPRALGMYERSGFRRARADVSYESE